MDSFVSMHSQAETVLIRNALRDDVLCTFRKIMFGSTTADRLGCEHSERSLSLRAHRRLY